MGLKPVQEPGDLEHGALLLFKNEIISPAHWIILIIGNNIAKDLVTSLARSNRLWSLLSPWVLVNLF